MRPRKPRLPAEVSLLDLGISPEGSTGAAEEDAPGLNDVGAVRDLERAQRVLLDQQNRDAIVVDLVDDVKDAGPPDRERSSRRPNLLRCGSARAPREPDAVKSGGRADNG